MRLAVIAGDGIGKEVIPEAIKVFRQTAKLYGIEYEIDEYPYSADYYLKTGVTIPEEAFRTWTNKYTAVLLGALGDRRIPNNVHAKDIILGMRQRLDLYINLRPVKLMKSSICPLKKKLDKGIDFVVFRENTEDLYTGCGGVLKPSTIDEIVVENAIFTYKGVERIIRSAFSYARNHNKSSVIMSDKGNAMINAGNLWGRVFDEVGKEYPEIKKRHMYIDAMCAQVVRDPEQFEVVVTSNMFGDIFTDICAELQGGMGMASSSSQNPQYNDFYGVYEPVHGSAPDIAGKGIANPMGAIHCIASLFRDCGYESAAYSIENAIREAIDSKCTTVDLGGVCGTKEVGEFISNHLSR